MRISAWSSDVCSSDLRDIVAGLLAQADESAAPVPLRAVIRRCDGSSLPVEIMVSVLSLGVGRAVVTELRDITERVNAEAELSRVWRMLRDAVDNIPNGCHLRRGSAADPLQCRLCRA